jgi:hypothetical protein
MSRHDAPGPTDQQCVESGCHVFDRRDGLVHSVVTTVGIMCWTSCDEDSFVGCRAAVDFLGDKPSALRWRVDDPVTCMACLVDPPIAEFKPIDAEMRDEHDLRSAEATWMSMTCRR